MRTWWAIIVFVVSVARDIWFPPRVKVLADCEHPSNPLHDVTPR